MDSLYGPGCILCRFAQVWIALCISLLILNENRAYFHPQRTHPLSGAAARTCLSTSGLRRHPHRTHSLKLIAPTATRADTTPGLAISTTSQPGTSHAHSANKADKSTKTPRTTHHSRSATTQGHRTEPARRLHTQSNEALRKVECEHWKITHSTVGSTGRAGRTTSRGARSSIR